MVRSVTTFDPDWSDDDLMAALDWQHEMSLRCQECGQPMDESTDEAIAPAWIAEPVVCYACAASERRFGGNKRSAPGTKYRTRNRMHDA